MDKIPSPAELLPHSYPFVMIDRIVEYDEGNRVVCLKNVTINEEFFQGHFSDNPVMPWSLILEAMAQTSGMLLSRECTKAFIAQMKNIKIHGTVVPGDSLYITAAKRGTIGPVHAFMVKAAVDDEIRVEGEIMLAEIPKDMEL
jgi:3-hydroxyacyl-[acyl-carrier-protein] dehydratase